MTVSVIIPTHNRTKMLKRAIRSVLEQTVPVLEVLVCDDGSTDNSRELVCGFGDDRVVWIEGAHAGLPAIPRNRGLAVARGEWVAFLDSDDEWLPCKLQTQLDVLKASNSKAICSNAYKVIPAEPDISRTYFPFDANRLIVLDELLKTNGMICSSTMIRRDVLSRAGGFPENPALKAIEDYALWLRVACLTPVIYLSEPLVKYLDNPQESIRQEDVPPLEQRLRILQDANQWAEPRRWRLSRRARFKIKYALNTALGIPNTSIKGSIKQYLVSLRNKT